jgi:phosphate/sulfate permease
LKATEDNMPLPHFLLMILAVILAAGLTIWAANAVGIPLVALGLLALVGAALAHLTTRDHRHH